MTEKMDAQEILEEMMADARNDTDGTIYFESHDKWHKLLESLLSSGEPELQEEIDNIETCKQSGLPSHKCSCEICNPQEEETEKIEEED